MSDETTSKNPDSELREEYDFSKGVRGKYAKRFDWEAMTFSSRASMWTPAMGVSTRSALWKKLRLSRFS